MTKIEARELLSDTTPIDQSAVRRYRLDRVRKLLVQEDIAAVLLFDPVNIRYTNGSRNMQVTTILQAVLPPPFSISIGRFWTRLDRGIPVL